MRDVAWAALARRRFNMLLTGVFAATALALAMLGLYGLSSYQVAQRTREIGVRMALGARRADVLLMIVAPGPAADRVGLAIGAAGLSRAGAFRQGAPVRRDADLPMGLRGRRGRAADGGGAASLVPARRAMRADPVIALRSE